MKKETSIIPTWTIKCRFPTYQCTETDYVIDAHTVGLVEYSHPELAIVVSIPVEIAGDILNSLGMRIANGERFDIPGVYENILQEDYPVRLVRTEYEKGKEMMVLILPDEKRRLPEDTGCEAPYNRQMDYLKRIKEDYATNGALFKGN